MWFFPLQTTEDMEIVMMADTVVEEVVDVGKVFRINKFDLSKTSLDHTLCKMFMHQYNSSLLFKKLWIVQEISFIAWYL